MTPAPFRLEPLGEQHGRGQFRCGEEALDRYFQTQVTQDVRRRIANCFVVAETATGRIAAYYTLSATGVPLRSLPPEVVKRLPRYPLVPAVRIGRLAVDQQFRGHGLGGAMLADAAARALSADIAAFMLIVDAKNDSAVTFYRHHGFQPVADQPRTLFLPLQTAEKAWLSMKDR